MMVSAWRRDVAKEEEILEAVSNPREDKLQRLATFPHCTKYSSVETAHHEQPD